VSARAAAALHATKIADTPPRRLRLPLAPLPSLMPHPAPGPPPRPPSLPPPHSYDPALAAQLAALPEVPASTRKAIAGLAGNLVKASIGGASAEPSDFKFPSKAATYAYQKTPNQTFALYPQLANASPLLSSQQRLSEIASNKDPNRGPVFAPPSPRVRAGAAAAAAAAMADAGSAMLSPNARRGSPRRRLTPHSPLPPNSPTLRAPTTTRPTASAERPRLSAPSTTPTARCSGPTAPTPARSPATGSTSPRR
jgi:hypothetical protein